MQKKKTNFKFNEGALCEELLNYISKTYDGHYSKTNSNLRNLLLIVAMAWVLLLVMYLNIPNDTARRMDIIGLTY